eukprot:TRINITY_DN580_c1_g2_i2.p1 TRINITY_DN580_c1_g2~~TRINITY_DN580_c1_g2_i2.p1  ORF type:complete len:793 (-),score=119.22 TRINITY_DN580_c1_g2_i2:374-2752(-)
MEALDVKTPIEGFLYSFGKNKYGDSYCHAVFGVITGRHFAVFKTKGDKVPIRSGLLDSHLRLEDMGRQVVCGQTLYTLRLYNVDDPSKERQLGATRSEETAAWIKAFTLALEQPVSSMLQSMTLDALDIDAEDGFPLSGDASPPFPLVATPNSVSASARLGGFPRVSRTSSYRPSHLTTTIGPEEPPPPAPRESRASRLSGVVNATETATPTGARPILGGGGGGRAGGSGEVAKGGEANWRLVRCINGLRFFEEVTSEVFKYKLYTLPVMKCVGVVKADASLIFDLVMHYGPERLQWDSTMDSASVVETMDGHSDVVMVKLRQDWIWLRRRELVLSRYWIREADGSYMVFYKSQDHPDCPKRRGHVRAIIHSAGFIITPLKSSEGGKPRTLVEYVLEMDVAGWSAWFGIGLSQYPAYLRDSLLGCVAGIRDFFAAQRFSGSTTVVRWRVVEQAGPSSPVEQHFDEKEVQTPQAAASSGTPAGMVRVPSTMVSFLDTDDVDEEFFDADQFEIAEPFEQQIGVVIDPRDRVDPQPDYLTGEWSGRGSMVDWSRFQGNVKQGPLLGTSNCWSRPDGNAFMVRGETYLDDGLRVPAGEPVCKLVAVDWFHSDKRIANLGRRPQNLVQRLVQEYGENCPLLFVINMQVPGGSSSHYSLVFYFALEDPKRQLVEGSLLYRFINGDDVFRNSRLILLPNIPQGSWVVKQAAGSRPVPLGQLMEVHYSSGESYFEVDVNMGSSSVVRGVISMIFGYISMLVVDLAFVIKGDSEEELPEKLVGAVRCSRLAVKAAQAPMAE